jgi:aspartyl/asparaginyl beta-hydroxylase (cupin superfamily)
MYPDPTATDYNDTVHMERCSYVPRVLESFLCVKESVRFLRLGPGAEIREHKDFKLNIDDGVARVHVPDVTNEKVAFHLDRRPVTMLAGDAWYLDFNLPHSVKNDSSEYRIHLVIDLVANDWLRSLICN